jgi:fused signal recognition particle receptor
MEWIVALVTLTVLVAALVVLVRRRRRPPAPGAAVTGPGGRLREALRRDVADWDRVEEMLIAGDVGAPLAAEIVAGARAATRRGDGDPTAALVSHMVAMFGAHDRSLSLRSSPSVIVVVGVNGSGKTTTIAKLAALLQAQGSAPLLAAADTFRAAAVEQLRVWGDRLGVDVVGGASGGDPAAVAFDALSAARARGRDVVIVDTAGRLHSRTNLMDELAKVVRVLERENGVVDEVILIVDGSSGQNVAAQARAFTEAVGVTGIVLTKLDGTARGGMAITVEHGLGLPIKFVGVGEGLGDLLHFEPQRFVEGLVEGR